MLTTLLETTQKFTNCQPSLGVLTRPQPQTVRLAELMEPLPSSPESPADSFSYLLHKAVLKAVA